MRERLPMFERVDAKGKFYALACEAGCTLVVVLLLFVAGIR